MIARQYILRMETQFTFHYGSITMQVGISVASNIFSFTFHYGSITIIGGNCIEIQASKFTFHYGSITIDKEVKLYRANL